MIAFHCVGCRAVYLEARAPRRCDRCHGKAFSAVNDAVDPETAELERLYRLDAQRAAPGLPGVQASPAPLLSDDAALAAAFAESERFRLNAIAGRPYTSAAPPVVPEPASVPAMIFTTDEPAPVRHVLEGDDAAPPTPRDMPEQPSDDAAKSDS
jgi:rubredoxin